jgi:hypothetical protein
MPAWTLCSGACGTHTGSRRGSCTRRMTRGRPQRQLTRLRRAKSLQCGCRHRRRACRPCQPRSSRPHALNQPASSLRRRRQRRRRRRWSSQRRARWPPWPLPPFPASALRSSRLARQLQQQRRNATAAQTRQDALPSQRRSSLAASSERWRRRQGRQQPPQACAAAAPERSSTRLPRGGRLAFALLPESSRCLGCLAGTAAADRAPRSESASAAACPVPRSARRPPTPASAAAGLTRRRPALLRAMLIIATDLPRPSLSLRTLADPPRLPGIPSRSRRHTPLRLRRHSCQRRACRCTAAALSCRRLLSRMQGSTRRSRSAWRLPQRRRAQATPLPPRRPLPRRQRALPRSRRLQQQGPGGGWGRGR